MPQITLFKKKKVPNLMWVLTFLKGYTLRRTKGILGFVQKVCYFHVPCLQRLNWRGGGNSLFSLFRFFGWYLFIFKIILRGVWTIFLKPCVEFVAVLLLCFALVFWPQGVWDLSSLIRDWSCTPCTGTWSLNHWTTWEALPWLV